MELFTFFSTKKIGQHFVFSLNQTMIVLILKELKISHNPEHPQHLLSAIHVVSFPHTPHGCGNFYYYHCLWLLWQEVLRKKTRNPCKILVFTYFSGTSGGHVCFLSRSSSLFCEHPPSQSTHSWDQWQRKWASIKLCQTELWQAWPVFVCLSTSSWYLFPLCFLLKSQSHRSLLWLV